MDASSAHQDSLPISSDALLTRLGEWGIAYTRHDHVPLRTVEEAKAVEADIAEPGEVPFRLKNLYLRDRKKRNYLVTLEQDREIDLKALGAQLGGRGIVLRVGGSVDGVPWYPPRRGQPLGHGDRRADRRDVLHGCGGARGGSYLHAPVGQ